MFLLLLFLLANVARGNQANHLFPSSLHGYTCLSFTQQVIFHFELILVVCLSTNGERSLNYTIVTRLILTTDTQAAKIKSSF